MMDSIKRLTVIVTIGVVIVGLLVWLGYDVYAITKCGTECSISYMIFQWSYKYPLFTFICGFFPGVLVGHFFWRIRDTEGTKVLSDNSRV